MSIMMSTRGLLKYYGPQQVLENVNLDFESGKIIGLLGPNGCGKTTLMKILAGLINEYGGEVLIDGHKPGVYSKSVVSFLPEKTYLANWVRPVDAVNLFNDFYTDFDAVKAYEMMERLRINPKQKVKTMSKGMQEKVQLILVMSRAAKIYLLDEPLGGIDPASRTMILDTILNNYSENSMVLLSTHMIYDVERIFDSIIMMGYGTIVLNDSVDNIRSQSGKSVDALFREVFRC